MLLFGAVVVGYVYFTSLYNQDVLHFSPLQAGLAFIPATGTVMLTSTQLTRRVLPRFGVRKVLLAGLTITGLGQVWLSHDQQRRLLPGERPGRDHDHRLRDGIGLPHRFGSGDLGRRTG